MRKQSHAALHWLGRGFLAVFLGAITGCGPASVAPALPDKPKAPAPRPQLGGFRATLEDEVTELADGRIKWNTFWVLSWDVLPGADHYDLQVLTPEGRSPKLHTVTGPRFRLQSAAGENAKSEGFLKRDIQLALHAGQLSLRVRGSGPGQPPSAWSEAFDVGKAIDPK